MFEFSDTIDDWRPGPTFRRLTVGAMVAAMICFASTAFAGPERQVDVVIETESASQNLSAPDYGHANGEFDQNANGSYTNHGYLVAAPDDFKTYVNGEIVIWYLASGGNWKRNYGLLDFDSWTRTLKISGCEFAKYDYEATCNMKISAEAALTGFVESGDIYARSEGLLWMKVDGVEVAKDNHEVMAGTKDLDSAGDPAIASGTYAFGGDPDGGLAAQKVANDGTNPAKAELPVELEVLLTEKSGLDLEVTIHSMGYVRVRVPASYGWGRARVKHDDYPAPHDVGKYKNGNAGADFQDWDVRVTAWDLDQPGNPVLTKKFTWNKWGD